MTSSVQKSWFKNWLMAYAARLRFPWLLALTAALFIIDLMVPDMIPFADEILLGLLTVLLAMLKKKAGA
jgi:hypothetical protein